MHLLLARRGYFAKICARGAWSSQREQKGTEGSARIAIGGVRRRGHHRRPSLVDERVELSPIRELVALVLVEELKELGRQLGVAGVARFRDGDLEEERLRAHMPQPTSHAARCTLHAARCTMHAARCTLAKGAFFRFCRLMRKSQMAAETASITAVMPNTATIAEMGTPVYLSTCRP